MLTLPKSHIPLETGKTRCAVMGIVNVTPDSFSGDGLFSGKDPVEAAVRQAEQFVDWGAEILDIGGESTRPGAEPLSEEEEKKRVIPVITALSRSMPDVSMSIDTYKSGVAAAALDAGATMLNDVWAGRADPEMLRLAAIRNVPIVLMHNRASWGAASVDPKLGGAYSATGSANFMSEVLAELQEIAERALTAGISAENIILDPGIGFGKTLDQNLTLVREVPALKSLGYPILLGPSRKNFIGRILDAEKTERLIGTAAAVSVGTREGTDIVRVHDVREMVQVVRMTEAIMNSTGKE